MMGPGFRRECEFSLVRMLSGADLGPDRAADSGAAETAIAVGVFRQVLLVIVLGEVEFGRVADFGRDLAVPRGGEPCLVGLARGFGGAKLLGRIGVDRRAVLRADIVA